jgi:adenylate cyclase
VGVRPGEKMADPRRTVGFEVYALRQGRWEIHARFGPNGRDMAIRRAKETNRNPGVQAVRVVHEVFDSIAEITEEHTVYKSRQKQSGATYASAANDAQALLRELHSGPNYATAGTPVAPLTGLSRITGSALVIGFASAAAITFAIAYILKDTGGNYGSSSKVGDAALLAILFFLSFAGVTALAAFRLASTVARIPVVRSLYRSNGATPDEPVSPSQSRPSARKPSKTATSARKEMSPAAKEQSRYLKEYLRLAAKPVRGAFDVNDPFIRFGINLFTAGSCETLCLQRELDPEITHEVLEACVRALGIDSVQADVFSSNYVEYLISDPRYMEMFSSGRQAIQNHMAGKASASDELVNALHGWSTPTETAEDTRLVSVMFTRVANYEELLRKYGPEKAQEVLHAHNRIVDHTLVEFGGKRIKQVDNGIMAAFMDSNQSVRAGTAIRDRITDYNATHQKLKARVKIGLNAGKPVAEKNDLFGSSVQLASRIMHAAEPGQVLISQAIRNEVAKKPEKLVLKPCGNFSLKGFADPLPLFAATSKP